MKNKILDSDNKNGNRTKNYILRVRQNLESVCGENFKAIERGKKSFLKRLKNIGMASEKLYWYETPYEHQMINERGAQNYPGSTSFSRKIAATKGEKKMLLILIYYWSHLDLSAGYLLLLNMLYMSIRFFVQSGDVIDKWIEKANIYWRTTEFTSSQHVRQDTY